MTNLSDQTRLIKVQDVKDNQFELDEQIKVREKLMYQLGGQLYRSIVFDEIVALRRRYWDIRAKNK